MWRLLWRCGGTFGRHGSLGCFRIRYDTCRICHRGQSSRHPLPSNPDIRLCDSRLSSQHWLGFSTALGLPGHLEYPPSTVWECPSERPKDSSPTRTISQSRGWCSWSLSTARGVCAYQDGQRECVHGHVSQEYSSLDATFFPSTRGEKGFRPQPLPRTMG